ncbi:hypothetical protein M407DRAFT_20239 [Tulasnella calospora MUT 4182]|uniref:Zn(2)-C6 fungal-type domain-containing protein n=1 Tax=Tulasnella calospora MUT 4182 TaxID=1051891 RepID=A0A0C3QGF2_9AGAM|nr:hypothetical protein M407DRAFT_20239 [Tulasnella calospora MUT 4182]
MSSDHTQQLYQASSHKRKRTSFSSSDAPAQYPDGQANAQSGPSEATNGANGTNGPQSHIPKRGARACTACRKGKNRCEGESPCRRCQLSGTPCVFEKPEKKNPPGNQPGLERLSRLEGQYLVMQSQMIGMQSSLDRILGALQPGASPQQAQNPAFPSAQATLPANGAQQSYPPPTPTEISGFPASIPPLATNGSGPSYYPPSDERSLPVRVVEPPPKFPPLPGFAPPPHKFATYGIVPSTAPSSDDESEETLPRSSLNAPIEALQGLANAAAEAAAAPLSSQRKKRKRVEPTPRNAFPNVLDKGLVAESEARELYTIFFSGCHIFIPLFDPAYDTFEGLRDRTPFCFDAILAVASKIRAGTGPPSATFHRCLEEAQGIARSTLFGPVVRKEAVQAMLLLAAWSTNGWLPSGHAMRMALDLGLHRALEKLAEPSSKKRSDEEERDLVVSARIWLCLYWFDHQMSLGTGRPIILRDETSVRHCRLLLSHPMASPTDVRLVSLVELIAQKTQIYETLSPFGGQVTHSTLAFVRRANTALEQWWEECDGLHRPAMDEESLMRKILSGELMFAKVWLVCVALRGVNWDKMPFEQRELAFQAKEAASNCLATFLQSPEYRAALRYAVHDSLVTAAFSGLFLLKIANLFPGEVDINAIILQVEQLAQLLSEVAAERYALTIRLMLANLRRKIGMQSIQPTPTMGGPGDSLVGPYGDPQPQATTNFSLEDFGFSWPDGVFSPTNIPMWLQEANLSDLGLPSNAYDGIFIPMNTGWSGDIGLMPEAW